MRGNYMRCFYLPFHYPVKLYQPHYQSRNPKLSGNLCSCFRPLDEDVDSCSSCNVAIDYLEGVKNGKLPDIVIKTFKPLVCENCGCNYAKFDIHKCHSPQNIDIVPSVLSVTDLKKTFVTMRPFNKWK